MDIRKYVEENYELNVKLRRHLHENPELSAVEFKTLEYIRDFLTEVGISYTEIEDGGILGFIKGDHPGKTVLLRGDIDALPIQEPEKNLKNVRVCRSNNDGVMHACGHDAHTSMLMTAGKILNDHKDELKGNVILCFERGEEGGGNIMQIMRYLIENNIHYDAAFGQHVDQRNPVGKIGVCIGGEEAGTIPIDITVKGRGGHGSRPDLSNNPIDCILQIVSAIKDIRMKYIDPYEPITVGINVINAGIKGNIIPDEGVILGSARYFSIKNAGEPFMREMSKICKAAAVQFDCEVINAADTSTGVPPTNNDVKLAEFTRQVLQKDISPDIIGPVEPQLTSETFSHYAMLAPAVYINLGVTNPEYGSGAELHSQWFDMDETAMKYGVMALVSLAYEYLEAGDVPDCFEAPPQSMLDAYVK
ncbi:MAG: amidohydrolase [Firmicutes bacterium]|nr:amidohydrolase [Bacillota bacterium]